MLSFLVKYDQQFDRLVSPKRIRIVELIILRLALLAFVLMGSLGSRSPSGWTSTISIVLMFSGFMLLLQSLLGAYITRIFQETKGRPLYVIAERT